MFAFLRNRPGRVEFQVPPIEPGAHARAFVDRETEIDDIDRAVAEERLFGDMVAVDALLDERNALRPARIGSAPVIPGRS